MSKRIQTFLKPNIFCPDSCGRGTVKPLFKKCGFGIRIHWFRVDGGPIRVKNFRGLTNILIRVNMALPRTVTPDFYMTI